MRAGNQSIGLKKKNADKANSHAAPKGAIHPKRITAPLKRCPDTNQGLSAT
jgi:hypothetical protein